MLKRSSEDTMKDLDKRSLIWCMFMSSTMSAAVFLGQNYSENLHSTNNTEESPTLTMLFEISQQLIREQSGEIS